MSRHDLQPDDRRQRRDELLAERALVGLNPEQATELSTLGGADDTGLDLVAARLQRALMDPPAAMPAGVAAGAKAALDRVAAPPHRPDWMATARRAAVGFSVAAAFAVVALVGLRGQYASPELAPDDARAALVSSATDLVELRWQGTDHPDVRTARNLGLIGGEVIWSQDEGAGFVRVCHLSINDPATGAYRIWIWNEDDPDDRPMLCGTFDVEQTADFTVLPIADGTPLRLPVRAAVTLAPTADYVAGDELLVARLRAAPVPVPRDPSAPGG